MNAPLVGVLALQGAFVAHQQRLAELGVRVPPGAHARRPRRGRRARDARRREHDDVEAARRRAGCSTTLKRGSSDGHAGVRHVRRDDPARHRGARRPPRPAQLRGDRHRRAPQRLRAPGRQLRGRPRRRRRARRATVPRRVHPRPAGRVASATASRCSPSTTASRCSRAKGASRWHRSTPSSPPTHRLHALFVDVDLLTRT